LLNATSTVQKETENLFDLNSLRPLRLCGENWIGACVGNFQRELEEATQSPVPGFGFRVSGSNSETSKLLNFGTADLPASPINPDSTSPGHHCSSAWAKKYLPLKHQKRI